MKLIFTLILSSLFNSSFGQSSLYQNLVDTAIKENSGLFIYVKPIENINLNLKEMWIYYDNCRDYSNKVLDTIMFAEIILNSKNVDTSLWQDNELPGYIIVNNREESVSVKNATQNLSLLDIKKLKKQINTYNSTNSFDRDIYYFSRPIFDNSKKFAVIQWDNSHSGLRGGGAIDLYHLENNTWHLVGTIMRWRS